jgi:anti-sigma regulatory factor (Ser/Thr protein kinase)
MIQMDDSRKTDGSFVSITVPNQVQSIRMAASFLVQAAKDMGVALASEPVFELAIVEALNNAVKHGGAGRPDTAIVCELERADHSLTVRILDQGPGYDLRVVPRPDPTADDIMAVPESGYGLSIIQSVFPIMSTISRPGKSGVEMSLRF